MAHNHKLTMFLFIILRIIQLASAQSLNSCLNNGRQIQAWYPGGSIIDTVTWPDASGNGYTGIIVDSTGLDISIEINFQRIVTGNTSTRITFPCQLNSTDHTVFVLSRYNPTINDLQVTQRILHTHSSDANAFFGHHSQKSGVAFEGGWITDSIDTFGNSWVISSQQPNYYRGNKQDLTTNPGNTGVALTNGIDLMINQWGPADGSRFEETSDFQLAELIVFNELLSITEIICIENFLDSKYNLGITLPPTASPSKSPTNSTTDPTYYPTAIPSNSPTVDPTSNPITDQTMVSTSDPTIGDEEEYGIVVIVTINDTSTDIPLIVNDITSDLVSDIINNTCSKAISTERDENDETQLVITIKVCDESSENILLTDIQDNNSLSDKINEQGIDAMIVEITTIRTSPEDGNGNESESENDTDEFSDIQSSDDISEWVYVSIVCAAIICILCGMNFDIKY